jgi:hypothetical protein
MELLCLLRHQLCHHNLLLNHARTQQLKQEEMLETSIIAKVSTQSFPRVTDLTNGQTDRQTD